VSLKFLRGRLAAVAVASATLLGLATIGVADAGPIADRTLALIDGLGLRALLGDPEMPLERARAEVWHALAGDLGLRDRVPSV